MAKKLFISPVLFDYTPGESGSEYGDGSGAGGENEWECSWEDWQDMTEWWEKFGSDMAGYEAYCAKYGFDPYSDNSEFWPPTNP